MGINDIYDRTIYKLDIQNVGKFGEKFCLNI